MEAMALKTHFSTRVNDLLACMFVFVCVKLIKPSIIYNRIYLLFIYNKVNNLLFKINVFLYNTFELRILKMIHTFHIFLQIFEKEI